MWLDRFSGHSGAGNPAPFQRQASPIPRQSQHNAGNPPSRPPFNKRSSSLSLASVANASTSSLAGSLRPGNAPLGKSTPAATPGTDPVEVLQGIIGNKGQLDEEPCSSSSDTFTVAKPEQLVKAIDFRDRSLEQFAYQNNELMEFPNDSLVSQSADQYEKEKQRFQELHGSIAGCDDVLKSVEAYLLKFQAELSAVSAEIETLQSRSTHLGSQLENRKNVEQLLGPAVEGIAISPRTVRMISEGPINSDWIQALNELECHSASVEADSVKNVKAVEDVKPLLLDLKNKAVERIRDYLVAQIRAIRSPNINAQILQQQSLARYKEIYSFLSRHQPQLAEEILLAYVNTMKWYNLSNFTRYNQALDKLKIHFMDRNDLLGGETASQKSSHPFPSVRNLHSSHDPFTLGRRIDILKSSSPMALSSYLAEEDKSYHGVEVPFRNFNLALIDNISAEFSFMTETFAAKSVQQASRRVVAIFEPIFNLGHNLTKQLIENTADCLGILLCVRLNQQFAFELQRRKVPVADSYINGINMLLWPRFQIVMDMHHESLKRVASSSRGNISALSLTGGDKQSLAPHFLTQRFGQFLHSILQLSSEAGDNEPISNSLGRLTTEFEALLTKLSKACGEAKRKERFLFNNYSLLLTIISDTEGKLAEEQQTIVGAGVVGLAVARQLARRERTSTLLIERHGVVGTETSSRNSELHDDKVSDIGLRSQVIHAGLYYGHDTLKTTLCIKGRELLYSLCRKHDIPHRNTGKWIVAQDDGQWAECQKVHSHAQSIGVPTHFVGRQEAQRREPDVRAQAGILESPTTGIVDSHALMTFLHGDFEDRGGDCVLKTEVIDIEPLDSGKEGYKIFTKSHSGEEDSVTTEVLVNCAGLYACDISNMVLPKTRHRVPYFTKGSYFSYSASQPRPNILLYPAPKPGLGGLGTHLTLDMTGRVRFGPDVEWIDNPNDFKPNPARLQEAIPEIQAFLPGVDVNAIGTDYCGIRPKLSNMASVVKAKGFQDFVIQREEGFPGFINLLGIESPGLTSSLAIGEMVEGLVYR
ncbi:Vacuolar protein sorting-associated protein 52 [Ophidiomyces ophidiicola]|nr:Vacuolar protein sorting-associated protein 52 [Ophidiomyces ophidiicola]KAI1974306.1 Vacuolar protein sorting-associated protein 52 [Ophidiomyces ophidiicola]KAI2022187.1 Vacuolar protein sorting-associated protein 52 [Ophidiomyces ophidiicola]KAI2030460.1 Vacuolar protein sorting-associated protein 52 [Ophidiomyces ophidiicola]KAI2040619.1 Vacuolar protein sorting-associated protein 52 [Ophidiomyces ophidiicola]